MFIVRTKYHPASGSQPARIVASRATSRVTYRTEVSNSQPSHIAAARELVSAICMDPDGGHWERCAAGPDRFIHHFHPSQP